MKTIQIKCETSETMELDQMKDFQGDLKSLSKENYEKLRLNIENRGFRIPIFVWNDFIIDGHQRVRTLQKMKKEGYEIPPLPIFRLQAENEKDARMLLLSINSRFGEFDQDEIINFTGDLNAIDLKNEIVIPEIKFDMGEEEDLTIKEDYITIKFKSNAKAKKIRKLLGYQPNRKTIWYKELKKHLDDLKDI